MTLDIPFRSPIRLVVGRKRVWGIGNVLKTPVSQKADQEQGWSVQNVFAYTGSTEKMVGDDLMGDWDGFFPLRI